MLGGDALREVWLFVVAPRVGGVIAALVHRYVLVQTESGPTAPGEVEPFDIAVT